jgi:hypothetical protein
VQIGGNVHHHVGQLIPVQVQEAVFLIAEHFLPAVIENIRQADSVPGGLLTVGNADTPAGGADGPLSFLVQTPVPLLIFRKHDVGPAGNQHPAFPVNALLREGVELVEKAFRIDDHAGAQEHRGIRVENPRGNQVNRVLLSLIDQGVPGVGSAAEADDHVGGGSHVVHNSTLAFIAPLGADDY